MRTVDELKALLGSGVPDSVADVQLGVRPAANGWRIDCALSGLSLMFLSGAQAEAKAHALARLLCSAGHDVRVLVHDRQEQVVGTTRYFAEDFEPARMPVRRAAAVLARTGA